MSDEFWDALAEDLTDEELQTAISDAADDEVVCRVCASTFGQVTEQHTRTHELSLEDYRDEHPDATIYPTAEERQPGREPGFTQSEETKRKISEAMKSGTGGDDE
ncbi:hypothetical protein [Halogranum rubrum]|uniref:ROS/MUCR transcriptional regulator protein n=1 Tax=Halogranum salarium B-1 TaxID=1210908 RepID=J3JGW7_9EURY|nr:hypothetical protein [Halogranum salarium]EJN60461.1 hypothetical protein HSB1_10640 [Halogranum salarium B-1]